MAAVFSHAFLRFKVLTAGAFKRPILYHHACDVKIGQTVAEIIWRTCWICWMHFMWTIRVQSVFSGTSKLGVIGILENGISSLACMLDMIVISQHFQCSIVQIHY